MKKIQIFIEHDIIIRHFLHNNTFNELEKEYDIQYVFPYKDARVKVDINSLELPSVKCIPVDRVRVSKIRYLAKISTIAKVRGKPAFKFLNDIWKLILNKKVYLRMQVLSLPFIFPFYRKKVLTTCGISENLNKVIEDFKPDVIIHPSVLEGLFISDLLLLSEQKNIPFVSLMNSWDNPSTKGMVIKPPDWLVVWGEQTKRHAVDFLGVNEEKIKKIGAAQFEIYKKEPTISREKFCLRIGVETHMRLILYAGSSKSINEIDHLKVFEKAIASGSLADCHVVFRPHPWRAAVEGEPDFFSMDFKHVSMEPFMVNTYNNSRNTSKKKINLSNYMDTHNVLSAVDMLVSNVSTILLEAAVHEKPILCMVSDKELEENDFLKAVFNALYFKDLFTKLDMPRCNDHKDLPNYCNNLLNKAKDSSFKEELLNKVNFFVEMNKQSYGSQLKEFIDELILNGESDKKEKISV